MTDRAFLVVAALEQVATLRASGFRGDDSAVCQLLKEYGESHDLADKLWSDLPNGCGREDVADLLTLWSWRTNDNGAAIVRTLEGWVSECSDESKVWVALHQDAYPFVAHAERIGRLAKVAVQFPSLGHRCEAMITQSREWERTRNGTAKPNA
jgi:hypothetical protein